MRDCDEWTNGAGETIDYIVGGGGLRWWKCLHHPPMTLLRSTKQDPPGPLPHEPLSTKSDLRSGAMVVGSVVVGVSMDNAWSCSVVVLSACVDIHRVGDCRVVVWVSAKSRVRAAGAAVGRTVVLGST